MLKLPGLLRQILFPPFTSIRFRYLPIPRYPNDDTLRYFHGMLHHDTERIEYHIYGLTILFFLRLFSRSFHNCYSRGLSVQTPFYTSRLPSARAQLVVLYSYFCSVPGSRPCKSVWDYHQPF